MRLVFPMRPFDSIVLHSVVVDEALSSKTLPANTGGIAVTFFSHTRDIVTFVVQEMLQLHFAHNVHALQVPDLLSVVFCSSVLYSEGVRP